MITDNGAKGSVTLLIIGVGGSDCSAKFNGFKGVVAVELFVTMNKPWFLRSDTLMVVPGACIQRSACIKKREDGKKNFVSTKRKAEVGKLVLAGYWHRPHLFL